jgi:tRNA threonylcarbamoyladenosine biosynthesis protein TsaB
MELVCEQVLNVSATHSETVLPAIDRLLVGEGRSIADVSEVVVGSGPGSFTGVRIAASLARGICFAGRATLFAYSSLAAIAAAAPVEVDGRICALLDARREQVYAAGFSIDRRNGAIETLFDARASPLAGLLSDLDASAWLFAGVIPGSLREVVAAAGGRLVRGDVHPSGPGLLRLAGTDPQAGRIAHPARWEPGYVRASSAERRMGES